MKGLKGKTVVVTGASSGIGEALARECAVQGANVVLGARSLQKLQLIEGSTSEHCGAQAHPLLFLLFHQHAVSENLA